MFCKCLVQKTKEKKEKTGRDRTGDRGGTFQYHGKVIFDILKDERNSTRDSNRLARYDNLPNVYLQSYGWII